MVSRHGGTRREGAGISGAIIIRRNDYRLFETGRIFPDTKKGAAARPSLSKNIHICLLKEAKISLASKDSQTKRKSSQLGGTVSPLPGPKHWAQKKKIEVCLDYSVRKDGMQGFSLNFRKHSGIRQGLKVGNVPHISVLLSC